MNDKFGLSFIRSIVESRSEEAVLSKGRITTFSK